ncbi:hypothetical protein BKA61DRAFT_723382 [Leptodontidium sp. MPI-SDFR-AT-0119]|nr:hypothetical protein BKA61DRAFT_723382 [Leptodontidium sp. MPI-SDFR-AT-0119]
MVSKSISGDLYNGAPQHEVNTKYGQRLLPNVIDDFAARDPDHMAGLTAKHNSALPMSFIPLTTSQLANAVNFTSHLIDEILGKGTKFVIGYIGLQDFRYWVIELAAMKTGHPILLPSIRNGVFYSLSTWC